MGVRFHTHRAAFCLASIAGGTDRENTQLAMSWLKYWCNFQKKIGERGAVVFDVDDTLVDKSENAIPAVVDAYRFCGRLGFERVIVTARPNTSTNRKHTAAMLRANGIDEWRSLYLMPPMEDPSAASISRYKWEARRDVAKRHRVIANVGDMMHDHVLVPCSRQLRALDDIDPRSCAIFFPPGAHADVCVKLATRTIR